MSAASSSPRTGQVSVTADPARRPDVLLRRRMPEGHQVSAWWMIGAFVGVSVAVVGLLNLFPA
ncbi:UDP-N-acetylmuramyl pentapeptide phosphotransferase [Microbacterium sp. VKM Ac-2870]|uniref:UDP-N-acetylmuramyl pentapeptide phosphotransferase n=1 Tax=Microbacterium sp. VKM Ac-2870 TaxID=2783825 RepID=UPI00188AFA7D|nr:UDP-N-acetylmuramyl pentapeptide phosphotransferase [Microbacterium sp. VKM Ac-2870]MBF4563280.1 UDP-N-acetylmuramyl pentapeptide phosphotransferase [Microbacterium sp. VKM Ac-2870]